MKTSQKIELFIKSRGVKKGWIADKLGVSRPTLDKRMKDNSFLPEELNTLKQIGIS